MYRWWICWFGYFIGAEKLLHFDILLVNTCKFIGFEKSKSKIENNNWGTLQNWPKFRAYAALFCSSFAWIWQPRDIDKMHIMYFISFFAFRIILFSRRWNLKSTWTQIMPRMIYMRVLFLMVQISCCSCWIKSHSKHWNNYILWLCFYQFLSDKWYLGIVSIVKS